MVHRNLSKFDEDALKWGDLWRKGISQLVVLRSHLSCIADLKEKYNIRITFQQFNEFLLHSRWEIKLVEHILESNSQCDLERTLNQFVMPFLNANGISSDELVWAELQKSKYSDESKIVLVFVLLKIVIRRKLLCWILFDWLTNHGQNHCKSLSHRSSWQILINNFICLRKTIHCTSTTHVTFKVHSQ